MLLPITYLHTYLRDHEGRHSRPHDQIPRQLLRGVGVELLSDRQDEVEQGQGAAELLGHLPLHLVHELAGA